jgi:hypothetical protein
MFSLPKLIYRSFLFYFVKYIFNSQFVGCIASDNWRLCEKVLGMWKNAALVDVLCANSALYFPAIVAALVRGGRPHWNPTVPHLSHCVF